MDASVHVIVLIGAGERFFCAGANIGMLKDADPAFKYYFCLHANETLNRLEQTPKLVIAALNGHCVGGGLEVAMAADLRIAREGAGKIGLPEVTLGVLPGTGGTQRLARLVGKAKAMELMVTGALLTMEEAPRAGLVHQVWGEDVLAGRTFRETAIDYAKTFARRTGPAGPSGTSSAPCSRGSKPGFTEGLALERELQQRLFESDDAAEGPRRQPREAAAALHRTMNASTRSPPRHGTPRPTLAVLGAGTMGHGIAHAADRRRLSHAGSTTSRRRS